MMNKLNKIILGCIVIIANDNNYEYNILEYSKILLATHAFKIIIFNEKSE